MDLLDRVLWRSSLTARAHGLQTASPTPCFRSSCVAACSTASQRRMVGPHWKLHCTHCRLGESLYRAGSIAWTPHASPWTRHPGAAALMRRRPGAVSLTSQRCARLWPRTLRSSTSARTPALPVLCQRRPADGPRLRGHSLPRHAAAQSLCGGTPRGQRRYRRSCRRRRGRRLCRTRHPPVGTLPAAILQGGAGQPPGAANSLMFCTRSFVRVGVRKCISAIVCTCLSVYW